MRAKSWEYLAGIVDGDGCISIHCSQHKKNGKPYPHWALGISVYQQDVRLMKWLVFHFGGQYYRHPMKREKKEGYSWHAPTGKNGESFLLALIPYLMLKQEQAKLALEYMRLSRKKEDSEKRRLLAEKCAALNNRQFAPETNTPNDSELNAAMNAVAKGMNGVWLRHGSKIESELTSDSKSDPEVIQ